MTNRKGSHLRIAFNRDDAEGHKKKRNKSQQLEFSLPARDRIYLADISGMEHDGFEKLLQNIKPYFVLDVRVLPRLDLLAGSRAQALRMFESQHIRYMDLFRALRVTSYTTTDANPAFWSGPLIETIRGSHVIGPYLLLFDNRDLLDSALATFGPAIRILPRRSLQVIAANRDKPELMVM